MGIVRNLVDISLNVDTWALEQKIGEIDEAVAGLQDRVQAHADAVTKLKDQVEKCDEALLSESDIEDMVESVLSNGGYVTDSDVSDAVENALNDRDLPDGDELTSRMDDLEEKLDGNKGLSAEEVQAIVQTELGKLDTNLGVARMANALERIDQRLADIAVAIRITR